MLQVFHLDVAKVDLDIAYVAMAIHACFICFQTYVSNVSSKCFKSRYGGTHVAMEPVTSGQGLAATIVVLPWVTVRVSKANMPLLRAYAGGAGDQDRSHSHASA
jgi:uncharacterized membrane protein (DUF485 family)